MNPFDPSEPRDIGIVQQAQQGRAVHERSEKPPSCTHRLVPDGSRRRSFELRLRSASEGRELPIALWLPPEKEPLAYFSRLPLSRLTLG